MTETAAGMESKKNEEEEEEHGTGKLEFEASEIEYVSYGGEHHLPLVMSLVDQELSEPYSIFTYRYFVYLWPQLSFLVFGFVSLNYYYYLIVFVSFECICVVGFRHSTKVNVWERWCARWGSIGTLLEDTSPC